MLANHISDKVLISNMCKEVTQLNSEKTNQLDLKMGRGSEETFSFSIEDIQMGNRHMKRCSMSQIIRKT